MSIQPIPPRWLPPRTNATQRACSAALPPSEMAQMRARLHEAECRVGLLEWELDHARRSGQELRDEHTAQLRESEREAMIAASAIANLNGQLERERARAAELDGLLHAIAREYEVFKRTTAEVARLAGAPPEVIAELQRASQAKRTAPEYEAVGLHERAPDFLVKAARTAYRKAYHPDRKPPHERAAAEAAFKRHEAAFDRLFDERRIAP